MAGNTSSLSAAIVIGSINQTISFGVAPQILIGGTGTVSASATSGLAVGLSSTTPVVCSVSVNAVTGIATVTEITAGACTIAANQAGDASYNAATQVTQSITVMVVVAGELNDTGITACWNDTGVATTGVEADSGSHSRQDCRYGRDAAATAGQLTKVGGGGKGFDFTKIANDGSTLPASAVLGSGATDWACTRDNVTGLIWEVKTASGLRSQSHGYTWYDSNAATNGGSAGTASGGTCATAGRCDTEKYVTDVNAAALCGHADWRMPAKRELVSIVDYGLSYPAIDPTYFPNTPASNFWSASASAVNSNYAWNVYFNYGNGSSYYKGSSLQVRLVRAGQ